MRGCGRLPHGRRTMITKRKLNKKLDLIIYRQNFLATIILKMNFDYDEQKKIEKKWNELWYELMEKKNGERK